MVLPKLLRYRNYHIFCMENAPVIHYYNHKRGLNYIELQVCYKISKHCIFKFAFEKTSLQFSWSSWTQPHFRPLDNLCLRVRHTKHSQKGLTEWAYCLCVWPSDGGMRLKNFNPLMCGHVNSNLKVNYFVALLK
jgi:hypothetical protein